MNDPVIVEASCIFYALIFATTLERPIQLQGDAL